LRPAGREVRRYSRYAFSHRCLREQREKTSLPPRKVGEYVIIMKKHMKTKKIALASIIAATYASLVIFLPVISFYAWQIRIADALLPLSTILGIPAVIGVSIGCFIGNLFAPWGSFGLIILDAIGGSIANLIASYIAYRIAYNKNRLLRLVATLCEIIIVTIIVGSYLTYIFTGKIDLSPTFIATILGVFTGSVISIGVIGFTITEAIIKTLYSKNK